MPTLAAAQLVGARRRGAELRTGADGHRGPASAPAAPCAAYAPPQGDIHAPGRRQRRRHLGRRARRARRGPPARPAPARLRPGHRAAAARVRHKVYAADYVADVASDSAALQTSPVVEGTAAGPGADRRQPGTGRLRPDLLPARRARAGRAGDARCSRSWRRSGRCAPTSASARTCPTICPAIGPDPRVPGLFHACGHEGAGIGLATGTGHLIAQALTGQDLARSGPRPVRSAPTASRTDAARRPRDDTPLELVEAQAGTRLHRHLRRPRDRRPARPDASPPRSGRRASRPGAPPGASGAPRGVFCGIGVCFDCLVTVNGRPNQRACLVPGRAGDVDPHAGRDRPSMSIMS